MADKIGNSKTSLSRCIGSRLLRWAFLSPLALNFSVFEPSQAGAFLTNSPMTGGRSSHTSTLLPNGKVLVAGGLCRAGITSSAELYDLATGKWTPTSKMGFARYVHGAAL